MAVASTACEHLPPVGSASVLQGKKQLMCLVDKGTALAEAENGRTVFGRTSPELMPAFWGF